MARPQIALEAPVTATSDEIRRITAAVDKVPWSVSLMQILWTAGPVTLLGAWGGYLLGYGKAPTMENYVFFISYTVITGAAGILANLGYHLTRGRKAEKTSGQIEQVIKALLSWPHAYYC